MRREGAGGSNAVAMLPGNRAESERRLVERTVAVAVELPDSLFSDGDALLAWSASG